ncbi:MAG TPA: HAD-IA family hydrolase [Burkholderiaceae bacterium]|jgi:putative hydrolase of the HAD superfamily|nr:HAD-IA family hydrolase [Burkholderiaceae bacterium]
MPQSRDACPSIQAITLDLDDTLWPVLPTLLKAEQALQDWLSLHAPATAARYTPPNRKRLRETLLAEHPEHAHDMSWMRHEMLRRSMLEADEPAALADTAFEVFLTTRQQVTLYPDVAPVLERWSQRYRLVAVTNGNADIAAIGLDRYFHHCISAHRIGFSKPDPRMFHEACRAAGTAPSATLHVGDDWLLDVRAARLAGLQAAWLKRPDLKHPQAADMQDGGDVAAFDSLHAMDAWLHPDG